MNKDWTPQRQLLSKCIMVDEDWEVTTYDNHILGIDIDRYGEEYLFCRACQVSD